MILNFPKLKQNTILGLGVTDVDRNEEGDIGLLIELVPKVL